MSAGPKYEYHWADGLTVKKPIKCSAPKYIDYLMTWVQDQLDDETLFPSKIGKDENQMIFFFFLCFSDILLNCLKHILLPMFKRDCELKIEWIHVNMHINII